MRTLIRASLEIGFIVFLFYSNLLMGEFTRSGEKHARALLWAMRDVATRENLVIALIAVVIATGSLNCCVSDCSDHCGK